MKKACRLFIAFLLLAGVSGCGDGPPVIVHDLLVFWNEMCDYMVQATSEDAAKELLALQFKLLDKRHENLKDRVEKKMRDLDKDDATILENAILTFRFEIEATEERIKNCQSRLDPLVNPNTPNLKTIRDWPNSRKTFANLYYGKYMPFRVERPSAEGQKGGPPPTQIGKGLIPPRPDFRPR